MVASPNDTVVAGIGATITDAGGSIWTIVANGQIAVNGTVDSTTANVDVLAYYNGLVWQKNASNQWYSKTSPAATWVHWTGSTAPVPIPHVSANDATIAAGGTATLVDANGNVWGLTERDTSKGYQVSVDGAVDQTTANVVQMAIVNAAIWQENTSALWYSKTTPAASTWTLGTTTDPLTGVPEPVSLTWLGGGNNQASNPADWSPSVAPKAGYMLKIGSGRTMNLSGNALMGDTLSVVGNGVGTGSTTIDTSGAATLNLQTSFATTNINVAPLSTLALNATLSFSYLHTSGGTIQFIGSSSLAAWQTVLSDNIVGTGTVNINGGNASGASVEINGSVSSGLTFNIASFPGDAGLQIDHPGAFLASIKMPAAGWVGFMGIHATSGELLNGILEMFNGTTLVDTARFTNANSTQFGALQLQQNSVGVMLSVGNGQSEQPGGIGAPLPLAIHS